MCKMRDNQLIAALFNKKKESVKCFPFNKPYIF